MSGAIGSTSTFNWPRAYERAIICAADEGVPIGALNRIFKDVESMLGDDIRALLHSAVVNGRLVSMPVEDWPPLVARDQRAPTVQPHVIREEDDDLILKMGSTLRTTRLESRVFLVVLRRGHASREAMHDAVEFNRGCPDDPTDIKIVDVVVCKLRKKISKYGVMLNTVHSRGYEMSMVDREKMWSVIRG